MRLTCDALGVEGLFEGLSAILQFSVKNRIIDIMPLANAINKTVFQKRVFVPGTSADTAGEPNVMQTAHKI